MPLDDGYLPMQQQSVVVAAIVVVVVTSVGLVRCLVVASVSFSTPEQCLHTSLSAVGLLINYVRCFATKQTRYCADVTTKCCYVCVAYPSGCRRSMYSY